MKKNHEESARKVYGMVSNIDDNLKHLFSELKELGLYENSLIIFLTDNGPQQIRYTAGLRGRKGMAYEGGIRVPFFIHYPFQSIVNKEIETPAAHIDILPTILDICNINPPDVNLDGKSLLPVIKGEEPSWKDRPLFFHWQRGMPEPYRNIAVRKGDYKLVGHEPADANPEDIT
ncbi:Arylsulfatase [subsurface metagenome]